MRLVRDYAQTIPPINSIKDFTPGVELLQKILPYLNSKYEIIESRFISHFYDRKYIRKFGTIFRRFWYFTVLTFRVNSSGGNETIKQLISSSILLFPSLFLIPYLLTVICLVLMFTYFSKIYSMIWRTSVEMMTGISFPFLRKPVQESCYGTLVSKRPSITWTIPYVCTLRWKSCDQKAYI